MRRLQGYALSAYFLSKWLKGELDNSEMDADSSPPLDAVLLWSYFDALNQKLVLVFQHDSFDHVIRDGEVVPWVQVLMKEKERV